MTPCLAAQTSMVSQLNYYCFRNIWNEVHAEYNNNMAMQLITPRFVVGFIQDPDLIALPTTTDQYAVYIIPIGLVRGGLPLPPKTWFSAVSAITNYQVQTNVYSQSGKVLPKRSVYYYIHRQRLYIAVQKIPLLKIIGIASYPELYLTIFRSDAMSHNVTCQSFYIAPTDNLTTDSGIINGAIAQALSINTPGTIVTVNGIEKDGTQSLSYNLGDYVDVVCDNNVIGAFSVNVSNGTTGYYSTKYSRYKEVIHTPISLNPSNNLVTNNTVTFYVRSNTTNNGVFLHRNDPTGVTQITHNDIGIATTVIQAHRDDLNDQNVSIYARIRTMGTNRVLINDASYLDILYTLSDTAIFNLLTEHDVDNSLAFWSASSLETSGYIALMFHTPVISDPTLLPRYINSLGYYTVASILSNHIQSITVTDPTLNPLIFNKGYAFINTSTYPMVFINGLKIVESKILHADMHRDVSYINIADTVYRSSSDVITVSFIPDGPSQPYLFTPTISTPSFTVPFEAVEVYQINTLSTPVTGYGVSSSESFTKRECLDGTLMTYPATGGPGTQVVFGLSQYGMQFLIKPKIFVKSYSQIIDTMLTSNLPLIFTLNETCVNDMTDTSYPLLGYNTLEVFINSKFLIPGIDYTCIPITDPSSNTAIVQVMIVNKAYLGVGSTGNVVEIIAHTSEVIQSELGYVFDGKVSYDDTVNFIYPGLTNLYVNGLLSLNPVDNGNYLTPSTSVTNGNPYYIQTSITEIIDDALCEYVSTIDTTKVTAINEYLLETAPIDKSFIIIPRSYQLYSVYLQAIISDIVNGVIGVVSDPNDATFLAQFAQYGYLKTRDPTLCNPSSVDRRYADVYPTYAEITVPLIDTYNIVQRLLCLILPPDSNTLGYIVNS